VFDTPCPSLPDETTPETRAGLAAAPRDRRKIIAGYTGYTLDQRGTNLHRADLSDLALSGANLEDARLEGADLSRARMEGATLSDARMEGADLSRARMEGADLTRARMEGANLSGARVEGADLRGARMEGADLSNARIEGASLSGAQFDASTDWEGALLLSASVRSVDFADTPISADQVNSTFGDGSTKLPGTIPRPAHWPKAELDRITFLFELAEWRADPEGYTPPD
jgi:uncharacterized protein YjbI with pentapeptide repeats